MDSEKNLLKQDLSNQEKPEEIKKFIEDAELLGHEDIAELGKKKLQEILEKADSIEKTSETQVAQVESMGGTTEEVNNKTKEVDEKIENVKAEAIKEVEAVKNTPVDIDKAEKGENTVDNETQKKLDEIKEKEEKIEKFNKEMNILLDQALSKLPEQMKEYFNSEEYKKLLELNNKKNEEEKSLFEAYEKFTKGGDENHKRGFAIGRGTAHYYIDDLKFNNAPKEIIKRFEDFDDKVAKPTFDAEWPLTLKARDTILKDKNVFLDSLQKKVNEEFKDDSQGREEAYKKGLDSYNDSYNKIKNETAPEQKDSINTMGTIYS